jgi:hypothetical protein
MLKISFSCEIQISDISIMPAPITVYSVCGALQHQLIKPSSIICEMRLDED